MCHKPSNGWGFRYISVDLRMREMGQKHNNKGTNASDRWRGRAGGAVADTIRVRADRRSRRPRAALGDVLVPTGGGASRLTRGVVPT